MNEKQRRLDPPRESYASLPPPLRERPYVSSGRPPSVDQPAELRNYLDALVDGRWTILLTTLAAIVVGLIYLVATPPLYESDVVVQVEEKGKTGSVLEELTGNDSKSPADTETEILRSRSLLGTVVDDLQLQTLVSPRYLPVVGRAIAGREGPAGLRPSLPALDKYAWGGEHIRVERFQVPRSLEGKVFTLVAGAPGRFKLVDPGGATVLSGELGKLASSKPDAPEGQKVDLLLGELTAREGTEFRLQRMSRASAIDILGAQLGIAEKGRKTGLIRVSLEGTDPELVAAILEDLGSRYVRRNIGGRSAEAEKKLAFLTSELPKARANVDAAERALNRNHDQRRTVDVTLETKSALDRLMEVEKEYTHLEMQSAEMGQKFAPDHPLMTATRQKLARLKLDREEFNARLRGLPEAESESARLMRDLKVASELYVTLLDKSQELEVVKNGIIPNVQVVDGAQVAEKPVRPQSRATLAMSLLGGLVLGVALTFTRKALLVGVHDPDVMERETGLPVYAAIPHSPHQEKLSRTRRQGGGRTPLAVAFPDDIAVEAIRSLRTSVQFAVAEAENGIVAIAGPSPSVGKSFVSINLALVLRDAGKRVLLVDGDMRKGRLHRSFDLDPAPGLSDLIHGTVSHSEAIHNVGEGLDFIPMGTLPPNPSELLSSARFKDLVEKVASLYDIVLMDTAPLLAVTDGVLIGRLAGTNLVVVRAGQHTAREVSTALNRMEQNGVEPHALVMNDFTRKAAERAGGYIYQY